jgi:hypothetical protein
VKKYLVDPNYNQDKESVKGTESIEGLSLWAESIRKHFEHKLKEQENACEHGDHSVEQG